MRFAVSALLVAVLGLGVLQAGTQGQKAPASEKAGTALMLPANYRHWTHVKSMAILDPEHPLYNAFAGIHHVYVNDRGLATLRKGTGTYPDGTVFVFDLLEAPTVDKAVAEGKRKAIAIMVKDAARFASTGGWGWELFPGGDGSKRGVKDASAECYACHISQKNTDYVYTKWRP
jgi:hypothetical protein